MEEPLLRHSDAKLPAVVNNELWTAPTAAQWARLCKERVNHTPLPTDSRRFAGPMNDEARLKSVAIADSLTVYAKLESLGTKILENRVSGSLDSLSGQIIETLVQLYGQHLRDNTRTGTDLFCLRALWHCVFISLFADINRIELAVGREGFKKSQDQLRYVNGWATSTEGTRCALHAALVLKNVESLSIGAEPAIHVPRVVYRSALVWYAYTRFGQDDPNAPQTTLDFPELTKFRFNGWKLLFEANGFRPSRPAADESSTLCCLVNLLKQIGHWGISRNMSSLMMLLIYGPSPELDKESPV